jgi:hypothetical protein
MASRLFHAVVGIGISLGTTSLACSGRVTTRLQADDVTADEPAPLPSASPVSSSNPVTPPTLVADAGTDAFAPVDDAASPDATSLDGDVTDSAAVVDASTDALLDAFCDAAWPTTKGTPPQPPPCP